MVKSINAFDIIVCKIENDILKFVVYIDDITLTEVYHNKLPFKYSNKESLLRGNSYEIEINLKKFEKLKIGTYLKTISTKYKGINDGKKSLYVIKISSTSLMINVIYVTHNECENDIVRSEIYIFDKLDDIWKESLHFIKHI